MSPARRRARTPGGCGPPRGRSAPHGAAGRAPRDARSPPPDAPADQPAPPARHPPDRSRSRPHRTVRRSPPTYRAARRPAPPRSSPGTLADRSIRVQAKLRSLIRVNDDVAGLEGRPGHPPLSGRHAGADRHRRTRPVRRPFVRGGDHERDRGTGRRLAAVAQLPLPDEGGAVAGRRRRPLRRVERHDAGPDRGAAGVDLITTAKLLIRDFIAFSAAHPQLHRIITQESKGEGERIDWLVDEHVRPLYEMTTGLFERLVDAGAVPDIPAPYLYYLLTGAGTDDLRPRVRMPAAGRIRSAERGGGRDPCRRRRRPPVRSTTSRRRRCGRQRRSIENSSTWVRRMLLPDGSRNDVSMP